MKKKYYEVVFEGHYNAIYGVLKGFLLASNQHWRFYFSKKYGINKETMMDVLKDWVSLKGKLHHVVMEGEFFESFAKAIDKYNAADESSFVNQKYIKSSNTIKDASFEFSAETFGKKYGIEIKAILNKLHEGLVLHDYNPMETVHEDAKGVELYAPDHDYVFEAKGRISGDINELVKFRKVLDDHALVEVKEIKLVF
ncbi:MAG: hypothetical protein GY754_43080 [bacterium]|nr:hypothetical protein [bacterium]